MVYGDGTDSDQAEQAHCCLALIVVCQSSCPPSLGIRCFLSQAVAEQKELWSLHVGVRPSASLCVPARRYVGAHRGADKGNCKNPRTQRNLVCASQILLVLLLLPDGI